jgi:hypothetical protein
VEITTILCGFVTIFIGVFMVNASKPTQPSMPGQGDKSGSRGSLNLLSQEIALKPLVQSSLLRSMDPSQREFNMSDGEEEDEQRLVFSSSPV